MLTFLFSLILLGVCSWVMINRLKTQSRPHLPAPPPQQSNSPLPTTGKWDWVKEEKTLNILKALGIALLIFAVFNLALWAGMSEFQNEWGKSYFWDTWVFSPVFLLLAVIIISLAFLGKKKDVKDGENRFGPFVLTVIVIAFVAGANAILPGFLGPKKAEAKETLEDRPVSIAGLPAKLNFDPADSLPAVTDSLIEVHFGDLGDSVVTTMKRIAWAESRGKHWETLSADSLTLVRGKNPGKPDDVGLFQIHEGGTHKVCLEAGHDYLTLSGNLACARFLYNRRRFRDWDTSAWSWRDRYSRPPEHWSFDRTPEQLAVANGGGVEVVIVDAPTDTTSLPIHTYGRKYCVRVMADVAIAVTDDAGAEFVIENDGGWSKPPRYPKWFSFRSLGDEPAKIAFTRIEPGTTCPGR